MVPALGSVLRAAPPVVVVVDDLHVLRQATAQACVEALLDDVGPTVTVVLAGRTVRQVGVPRRRLAGHVVEIGPDELMMDRDEARRLLAATATIVLDDQVVDALVERTEGWPAGLHLAGLRLAERGGDALLSGRDRLVAGYLVDEVLAVLDDDVVDFLERSSVLETLDAAVLDALLDRHDSAQQLRALEDSGNLLLVPLDDERRQYRYHHLFAELLRDRLALRGPVVVSALHCRAAALLDAAGDTDGAIAHLIASGDEAAAAARILAEAPSAALHGRAELIERWLDQLGPWAAERQVDAALASAWAAVGTFAPDAFAGAMARVTMIDPDAVDAPAVALVRAVRGAGGLDRALRDTEVAVDGLAEGTVPWALAVANRGSARLHLGDVDGAIDDLTGIVDLLQGVPAFAAVAHGHLALLHLDQGDLDRARASGLAAARIVRDAHLDALVLSANPRAAAGLVAVVDGRRDEGRTHLDAASVLLERAGVAVGRFALIGDTVVARGWALLGEWAAARRHLALAEAAQAAEPASVLFRDQIAELRRTLADAAASGDRPPLTAAEQRLLPLLPTHLSLQQIADELCVSRNTVKTHSVAIYRKLGVSSRGEAVAEARRIGLIRSG
ncbi:MAG: LuxR C-terminal-related transcriptional regulator [Acidimicrobiales bacterium]